MGAIYRVEDGRVFNDHHYTGLTELNADAASFRIIRDATLEALPDYEWCFGEGTVPRDDVFAADRASVWFMNVRVPDADPATFEGFHGGQCRWGRDHDRVWCFHMGAHPKVKPMKTALSDSFGFFPERCSAYMREYARDAQRVYYYGRRVTGARPDGFESVTEDQFLPDRMRTPRLAHRPDPRSDYHRDAHHVWYKGRQVVGADVASFRALEGGFGVDRSGFWDRLDPIGRQLGREHFDLYVASRPELAAGDWHRLADATLRSR